MGGWAQAYSSCMRFRDASLARPFGGFLGRTNWELTPGHVIWPGDTVGSPRRNWKVGRGHLECPA